MKKLGIIANIDSLNKIPEGDKINYMGFIANYFREKRNLVLMDWREIDGNIMVGKYLICNKKGMHLKEKKVNLNEICDLLFIKNLGKVCKEQKKFLDFLESLDKFKGSIINPLKAIKNNLSKQYILDFQENGFPIIPTIEISEYTTLEYLKSLDFSFSQFYDSFPKDLVVKPKLFGEQGIGAEKLSSFKNEKEFQEYFEEHKPIMVQPLIENISKTGENSFIFLDGKYVHSVNKFTGKFKINCCKGIVCSEHQASEEELRLCEKIIQNWPDKINYIRIDLIPYGNGNLISEIEVVNPAFYFENVLSLKDNFVRKLEEMFFGTDN